jgi:hypothetical protein
MEGMGLDVHIFSDNNTKFSLVYITTPRRTELQGFCSDEVLKIKWMSKKQEVVGGFRKMHNKDQLRPVFFTKLNRIRQVGLNVKQM